MAIPKKDLPRYKHFLKGLNKEVTFRPFTVREQKNLLLAKESESPEEMIDSMKQIVEKCTDGIDVHKLPIFDFEDLFLRIRCKSVSEHAQLHYRHKETKEKILIDVDLREVEVQGEPKDSVIMFTENYGVEMTYPTIDSYKLKDDEFILSCIKTVFSGDEVTDLQSHSKAEQLDWLDELDPKDIVQINDFLTGMPVLKHVVTKKLSTGEDIKIELKGLYDFFY